MEHKHLGLRDVMSLTDPDKINRFPLPFHKGLSCTQIGVPYSGPPLFVIFSYLQARESAVLRLRCAGDLRVSVQRALEFGLLQARPRGGLKGGYGEVTRRLRVADFAPEPGPVFVGAPVLAGRSTPFPIKSDCS